MWNICRAQCPVYLLDKNPLSSGWTQSSSVVSRRKAVQPPVTTLSTAFFENPNYDDRKQSPSLPRVGASAPPASHNSDIVIHEQPINSSVHVSSEAVSGRDPIESSARWMMDSVDQTEYKNQFQWRLPMVETKPPPPEPMVSQYTLSFGTPTPATSQSLSNSYSRQSSNDHTDSSLGRASPHRHDPSHESILPVIAAQPSSPIDLTGQSEYHAKFQPFDEYVYVEGGGFKKQDQLTQREKSAKMVKSWVSEVEERSRQATAYRVRSKNGDAPNNPDTTWNGSHVRDRDLQALALATRLIIADKKIERKFRSASVKPSSRVSNASSRYLNSAPPSLRNETPREAPIPRAVPRKQMPAKANQINGHVDKNNNNKTTPGKSVASKVVEPNSQKVWIKPKKSASKEGDKSGASAAKPAGQSEPTKANEKKEFESEPKSCPLRTTDVKSPEQLAGIKSPSPESWKVSIEKGGLNWVNGSTPVNFADGGKFDQTEQMVRPVPINGHINDDLYGPLSA